MPETKHTPTPWELVLGSWNGLVTQHLAEGSVGSIYAPASVLYIAALESLDEDYDSDKPI